MRWPFPLVWVVPVLALVVAGYYWWQHDKDRGPEVVVTFADATGLRAGDTSVTFRGVEIGKVSGVSLGKDLRAARVAVQLDKTAGAFAKAGARYWVIRPEISVKEVTGLGTVLSGPVIAALPGDGGEAKEFVGLAAAPAPEEDGISVSLRTDQLDRLQVGAPVYYRGIQVGEVREARLAGDSSHVDVRAFIQKRYVPVVRRNTRFWMVAGADVKGGIFSGVEVKLGTLRSILSGGVAFATPDSPADPVREGDQFELNSEPRKEWLTWSPRIPLAQEGE
jgi:paraquat-inducible protein B